MFKASCIQICSGKDAVKNLSVSKKLILKAIKQKSDFIITPETSSLFGLNKKQLFKMATSMHEDIYLKSIKRISKKYGLKFLSSGLLYRYASYQLLKYKPKNNIIDIPFFTR